MDKKYALAVGDAFSGLTLYGPFDTTNEAHDYAERTLGSDTYVIVELEVPSS
jgi:hypothetical protein